MKLSTASAILCTTLLASFCNAFPYLDYWDREAFLDQLQQEERVGTDVEAWIEQADESECPDPLDVDDFSKDNAIFSNIVKHHTKETFEYRCESGYTLHINREDGNGYQISETSPITYECTYESGSYLSSLITNGIPSCLRVFCPILQNPPNGDVRFASRRPGATAIYFCDPEYYLSGNETRTCSQDGKWSGQEPTCEKKCPMPNLPNGEVIHDNREPGGIANYSCSFGYRLKGPEERECNQDGTWSGKDPVCEAIICPLVNPIPNGEAAPSRSPITVPGRGQSFPLDTVVTYTCGEGFELQGESKRTCLENEEWDHPEPHCAPIIICPLVNPIPNGEATPSESPISGEGGRQGFPVGTVVTYTCDEGFELQGGSERTCLENGEWDHPEPRCVILCPLVNPIPNGQVVPSGPPVRGKAGSQGFLVDTVVTYTCDEDFEPRGESIRICLESGEWNHPEPYCNQTKCHKLKEFDLPKNVREVDRQLKNYKDYENVASKPYYYRMIKGDRSVGSKAYLKCMNNWKLLKGTPAMQTCVSENGALVWTKAGICVFTYKKINYG